MDGRHAHIEARIFKLNTMVVFSLSPLAQALQTYKLLRRGALPYLVACLNRLAPSSLPHHDAPHAGGYPRTSIQVTTTESSTPPRADVAMRRMRCGRVRW